MTFGGVEVQRSARYTIFLCDAQVKPDPPQVLSWGKEGTRLRIEWEPPLWNLSAHLEYQIRYRCNGESVWKVSTQEDPRQNAEPN